MNCKVNGIPVNENMSLKEVIAQYGINLSIEFEKEKNEQDFFNDFNLHGIHPDNMLSAISAVCKTDKVTAIKITRYCTGWGLKESKEFVEHLMAL